MTSIWDTREKIIEESKKYNKLKDFQKQSGGAFSAARKLGMLNELTWLSKENRLPKGYWKNKKNIMAEAKKYKTKEEFQKGNLTAFLAAHKYGYMEDMTWLVKRKQHKWGYWTYENIKQEAIKYDTKTQFFKGNQTAYRAALKLGIIDDFFGLNDYVQ